MSDDVTEHKGEAVVLDSSFLDPNLPSKTSGDGDDDANLDDPNLDPVLIILNHNLPRLTAALWRRARLVLVADGGADRLLEASRGWEEAFGPSSSSSSSSWRRRRRSSDGDGGGDGNGNPSPLPSFLPDFIVGDLDSISREARLHYGALGVPIVDLSPDQDSTDLQKCLAFAAAEVESQKRRGRGPSPPPSPPPPPCSSLPASSLPAPPVFVAGALGGRLDHSLSAISTLYAVDAARAAAKRRRKEKGEEEEEDEEERQAKGGGGFAAAAARSLGEIVLAGDGSLARLVPSPSPSSSPSSSSDSPKTVTTTTILPCAAVEGPGCGLVALGAPAAGVETSGLKWNLGRSERRERESREAGGEGEKGHPVLGMGGLQSTSNSLVEGGRQVTVTASDPLLWTTTLREEWR